MGLGMTIRTIMNHNAAEMFFDKPMVPTKNLVGEEGKGYVYFLDEKKAERP